MIVKILFAFLLSIVCTFTFKPIVHKLVKNRKKDDGKPLDERKFPKFIIVYLLIGITTVFALLAYALPIEQFIIIGAAMYLCSIAGVFDAFYRRIPNSIVGIILLLGIAYNIVIHSVWWNPLAAFGIAFLVFVIPSIFMPIGAGDIKLMLALAVLSGFPNVLYVIAVMAISALLYEIRYYAGRKNLMNALKNMIPYAPFITIGYITTFLYLTYYPYLS